jgi:hypothetical protein
VILEPQVLLDFKVKPVQQEQQVLLDLKEKLVKLDLLVLLEQIQV